LALLDGICFDFTGQPILKYSSALALSFLFLIPACFKIHLRRRLDAYVYILRKND